MERKDLVVAKSWPSAPEIKFLAGAITETGISDSRLKRLGRSWEVFEDRHG